MQKQFGYRRLLMCTVWIGTAPIATVAANAQTTMVGPPVKSKIDVTSASMTASNSDPGESVVVTGTRSLNKKARDSNSPIDVITSASLARSGQTNLTAALTILNPAVSAKTYGVDAGALTNALRLRGLSPDQVLVLIDGKRRHTTANIYAPTGPDQGTTPVDLDMIPMSMVDHIEVLRDGAAAQYGSDAIAGVINIILKKSSTTGSAHALTGATSEGDGWTANAQIDQGARLGSDGFIHIGADFTHKDHTDRGLPDSRTGTNTNKAFGDPEQTRENFGVDASKPIFNDQAEFYGNLTYAHRHGEGYENYRLPTVLPAYFPQGFTPIETSEENDYAVTLGLRTRDFLGFRTDFSTSWGEDNINIGIKQSPNLDLYADTGYTPTTAHLQAYTQSQWTNNLDLSRDIHVPLLVSPMHLAFGAEHRLERYEIGAGGTTGYYGSGTQALVATPPANAGTFYRDVYAGYIDLETHITPKWDVDVAGRVEYYTDAGHTENGKIATRYDFTSKIAVRGTISNGFRAPSLAQQHFSNLFVAPLSASGQVAVDSVAARLLGARPLKPERSTNVSGGIVISPIDRLHIAVDAYQIDIRDRIVSGGSYNGETAIAALMAQGIKLPSGLPADSVSAQYFTNGASTRTQGMDVTMDYRTLLGPRGHIDWTAGIDLNRSTLRHLSDDTNGQPLLNAQGISYLTRAAPRSKIILGGHWTVGRFDLNLRETRWGSATELLSYTTGPMAFSNTNFIPYTAKPRWLTDLEIGYRVLPPMRLAIGATDIFNTHPSRIPLEGSYLGTSAYSQTLQQVGIDGGFYYARADYNF